MMRFLQQILFNLHGSSAVHNGYGDVADLKNVKLEPMLHKVTNVDCYY
jgi:hypothetical protein